MQRETQYSNEEMDMDTFTQLKVSVIACRHEDLLRQAEQERLVQFAIATRPRARASSAGMTQITLLGLLQGMIARFRSDGRPRTARGLTSHGDLGQNFVGSSN